jgi:hypothetical protein
MKPYLIFIDGGNAPQVIHASEGSALKEANRLAKNFPDKEIMILQVLKRLKSTNGVVESIGSHIPPMTASDLIPRKTMAAVAFSKKTKKPIVEYKATTLRLPTKGA